MAKELVITPRGSSDIDIGGFFDDEGKRFVALSFVRADSGERVIVTFTPEFYRAFAVHATDVANTLADESYWTTVPRG
jgi:hypothetical protein